MTSLADACLLAKTCFSFYIGRETIVSMTLTLLNFEANFRTGKVDKARELFLKGQVIELRKARIVWMGRMKIGLYKVQVQLSGIKVGYATCTCDSRSKTGYCEHKLAVMFALRKELDLYPALTSSPIKLVTTDTGMQAQLKEINYSLEPVLNKEIDLFTSRVRAVLRRAAKNIQTGNNRPALADCFEVIQRVAEMDQMLAHDYDHTKKLTEKAFDLFGKELEKITDEALLEHIAHDLRITTLRNYRSEPALFARWMKLLVSISDKGNRRDKLKKVLDTLDRIEEDYPVAQL